MIYAKLAFLVCCIESAAARTVGLTTPVEKVVQLLEQIDAQIVEEGAAEAAQYDKYACFCKSQADFKTAAIKESEDKIAGLDADIQKLDADITVLNTDIASLGKKIDGYDKDIKSKNDARKKEHETYQVDAQDMNDAISACKRAMEALKNSKRNLKGKTEMEADMFVQLKKVAALGLVYAATDAGSSVQASQLEMLRKLAKDEQPGKAYEYSYHSNEIISLLETLKKTFTDKKDQIDQTEFDSKAKFDTEVLDLLNEKKFAEKDKSEKERIEAHKSEDKATADKDKADEETAKTADESFVKILKQECEAKAKLWDQRSTVRSKELALINEALQAIKTSVSETWKANKFLNGLVEKKPATVAKGAVAVARTGARHLTRGDSFLQLHGRHSTSKDAEVRQKVLDILNTAAAKVGTSVLNFAAMKVQVSDDHFVKVRSIINDLIARLEDQATAEATTKSFCDKHMKDTVASRDSEQAGIEDAKAQLTQNEAEKAQLMQDIAELSAEIAENTKALNEATELRGAEKRDNGKIVSQAKAGKVAVEHAIEILQDFYDEHEFLQKGAAVAAPNSDREGKTVGDRAPEIFDSKYRGAQKGGKGPIGMLNTMMTDFERTADVTADNEADAQRAYDDFKKKINDDNAAKQKEKDDKDADLTKIEDDTVAKMDDLKDGQDLLQSALQNLDKLRAICVEGEETYEERVAKRKQEVAALRSAYDILENWQ